VPPGCAGKARPRATHDLVAAEHDRQPLWFARGDDTLKRIGSAQRDTEEEPQGTYRLVDVRPGTLVRDQM
jgi:hypothetical protein